jgi:TetR/AcrR family transcriptional repressor of bet genes
MIIHSFFVIIQSAQYIKLEQYMAQPAAKVAPKSRVAAKERRREQLIKATINCVAKRGFASTTLSEVTKEAGLSLGIINLHFQSKDKLLLETLKYLINEYHVNWNKALNNAGPTPAEKLSALVELDFSKLIADRKKLAVWFAFWGETRSHSTYLKTCAEFDQLYTDTETELMAEIIREGKYKNLEPEVLATTLDAITDGRWLDMLLFPNEVDRSQGKATVINYLHTIFPNHF